MPRVLSLPQGSSFPAEHQDRFPHANEASFEPVVCSRHKMKAVSIELAQPFVAQYSYCDSSTEVMLTQHRPASQAQVLPGHLRGKLRRKQQLVKASGSLYLQSSF